MAEDADPEVERGRTQSQELGVRKLELRGQRLEVRERGPAQKQHARRSQSGYRLGGALRGGNGEPGCEGAPPNFHLRAGAASPIPGATKSAGLGIVPQFPPSRQRSEPNSGAARPGVWGCPPPFPLGGGAGRGIEEPLRIHQSNCKEGTWSYSKRWNKTTRKEELR